MAFASPFRGRSAERTLAPRTYIVIWLFLGARSASRGCTVHPARILAALVAFASPFRGRSAERTSRRGLFRICHFTGARSASRGCTDPPADAGGGLVHPARIELASPAPEAGGLSIILWVRMTYVSILF